MRIAILTTESVPHVRFAAAMAERHTLAGILVETALPSAQFETAHPFEETRDDFERKRWFAGGSPALREIGPATEFASLSSPEAAKHLGRLDAEIAFVLGTRRLGRQTLDVLGRRMVNLHGAEPQDYRGMDPELWAVYHCDFPGLVVTAHFLEPEVNAGAVLERQEIARHGKMELHELRHARTEAFIAVAEAAAKALSGQTMQMITPLHRLGRRYGFMPSALKDICVHRFRHHTETLP